MKRWPSKPTVATVLLLAPLLVARASALAPADDATDAGDADRGGARPTAGANDPKDRAQFPSAEDLYNLGVARYREGELEEAGRLFRAAAERGRSAVAARAMFNEGTTAYADALRTLSPDAPPAAPDAAPEDSAEDPLRQAIGRLESGLRILKDAIRADPSNDDARVNAEMTQRLLRQLRQQQEQEQQQQSQDQQEQDQQNQDQQNQDQQNRDQQNRDQQNQDQQNQDQQNQDQQNRDQQNRDQQNQDQQNQDQQNQDQQNQDQQNQDQQNQDQPSQPQSREERERNDEAAEPKPQPREAEKRPLNREEIERLLQRVRAKEAERLAKLAQEERARRKPAPKDW